MLLQACLNGSRQPSEHPRLPVTPSELAADAVAAVDVGAVGLHVHAKRSDGLDSLAGPDIDAAVRAVRAAVPGVPLGVTTGAWAAASVTARLEAVRSWTELPDFASVNWHEPGAEELASLLLDRGIGVEAGVWRTDAAERWRGWSRSRECVRVLLEVIGVATESSLCEELLAAIGDSHGIPVLLHGEGRTCWPVFDRAVRRRSEVRIGLEDTLTMPDGSPARDNRSLIEAALYRAREVGAPDE